MKVRDKGLKKDVDVSGKEEAAAVLAMRGIGNSFVATVRFAVVLNAQRWLREKA